MYIDEIRIILPSGKIINVLDSEEISLLYHYHTSETATAGGGTPSKQIQNPPMEYINGKKALRLDGLIKRDDLHISFTTKIPAYFINSVHLEYKLTLIWENIGEVKKHCRILFHKEGREVYPFDT